MTPRIRLVAAAAALLGVLAAAGCTGGNRSEREPSDATLADAPARPSLSREQFYFLLPDRFADGDPANNSGGLGPDRMTSGYDPTDAGFFHGGDLAGVRRHLDYIQGLGTTALWIAPVFTNRPVQSGTAGYHGYWITDFTQVDPHFGTNADLVALVAAAHAKGIKVFLDIVVNHTADVIQAGGPYVSKTQQPYTDATGKPFDDATANPFPKVDVGSFPYAPTFATPADATVKKPAWLNDPTMYHNRGDSTFTGEDILDGDIAGLDDLWTERPEVLAGMTRIYRDWVALSHVDGFRIDTAKHVDMAFWQKFVPAVAAGHPGFFTFGEVFTGDPATNAPYTRQGAMSAVLDFPFQDAARAYASQSAPAAKLEALYANDSRYASGYSLPTFLGNHDMGRIGAFLRQDNPGASAAELLRRDVFAHELMLLTRGQPVIYAGDEQGFTGPDTGDVGDRAARQDMGPTKVAEYAADYRIGGAYGPFATDHPVYRAIAALSALTKKYPALRDGAQTVRYAAGTAGVFAVSRVGDDGVENLVLFNNDSAAQTVTLDTFSPGLSFAPVYASSGAGGSGASGGAAGGGAPLSAGADGKVSVTVPPLSTLVLRASGPAPAPAAAPTVGLADPSVDVLSGLVQLSATVTTTGPARVTFAAQVGIGPWRVLGVADAAPYAATQDLSGVKPGTVVRYKAVIRDAAGQLAHAYATVTVPDR